MKSRVGDLSQRKLYLKLFRWGFFNNRFATGSAHPLDMFNIVTASSS